MSLELLEEREVPTVTLSSIADQFHSETDNPTLQVYASSDQPGEITYAASGLPDGFGIDNNGLISGELGYSAYQDAPNQDGVYTVSVTAVDIDGSAAQTFTWNVADTNRAPTEWSISNITSYEGDNVAFQLPQTTDPDGNALFYSVAMDFPPGLAMDSTGYISGTLDYASAGDYYVTIRAADGLGGETYASFNWTVLNTNRTPEFTGPGNQTSAEGESIYLNLATGTDPDGDTLIYTLDGTLPPGLSFDGHSTISGAIGFNANSNYILTVTATDSLGAAASATFTWNVNQTNQAPWFMPLPNYSHAEGDTVTVSVAGAFDADNDTLIYSLIGDLPQGLTMDEQGNIAGTISFDAAGSYPLTVVATDPYGAMAASSINWQVANTNRAPEIAVIAPQTHAGGDVVSLQVAASDLDGETLTYTITGQPAGVQINQTTGEIFGELTYESAGDFAVTVVATDTNDGSTTMSFTWTVNHTIRELVWMYEGSGVGNGMEINNWNGRLPTADDVLVFGMGKGSADLSEFSPDFVVAGLATQVGYNGTVKLPYNFGIGDSGLSMNSGALSAKGVLRLIGASEWTGGDMDSTGDVAADMEVYTAILYRPQVGNSLPPVQVDFDFDHNVNLVLKPNSFCTVDVPVEGLTLTARFHKGAGIDVQQDAKLNFVGEGKIVIQTAGNQVGAFTNNSGTITMDFGTTAGGVENDLPYVQEGGNTVLKGGTFWVPGKLNAIEKITINGGAFTVIGGVNVLAAERNGGPGTGGVYILGGTMYIEEADVSGPSFTGIFEIDGGTLEFNGNGQGKLNINGDFVMKKGTLIAAVNFDEQTADKIFIGGLGNFTLAGKLKVRTAGTPDANSNFTVFSGTLRAGQFAVTDFQGANYQVNYTANEVIINS